MYLLSPVKIYDSILESKSRTVIPSLINIKKLRATKHFVTVRFKSFPKVN